jgi:hypothetical protein
VAGSDGESAGGQRIWGLYGAALGNRTCSTSRARRRAHTQAEVEALVALARSQQARTITVGHSRDLQSSAAAHAFSSTSPARTGS